MAAASPEVSRLLAASPEFTRILQNEVNKTQLTLGVKTELTEVEMRKRNFNETTITAIQIIKPIYRELEKDKRKLGQKKQKILGEIKALRAENAALTAQIKEKNDRVIKLESDLAAQHTQQNLSMNHERQELHSARGEIEKLRQQLISNQNNLTQAESNLQSLTSQYQSVVEKNSELMRNIQDLQTKNQQLVDEVAQLTHDASESDRQIVELQIKNQVLDAALKEALARQKELERITALELEIQRLKIELERSNLTPTLRPESNSFVMSPGDDRAPLTELPPAAIAFSAAGESENEVFVSLSPTLLTPIREIPDHAGARSHVNTRNGHDRSNPHLRTLASREDLDLENDSFFNTSLGSNVTPHETKLANDSPFKVTDWGVATETRPDQIIEHSIAFQLPKGVTNPKLYLKYQLPLPIFSETAATMKHSGNDIDSNTFETTVYVHSCAQHAALEVTYRHKSNDCALTAPLKPTLFGRPELFRGPGNGAGAAVYAGASAGAGAGAGAVAPSLLLSAQAQNAATANLNSLETATQISQAIAMNQEAPVTPPRRQGQTVYTYTPLGTPFFQRLQP